MKKIQNKKDRESYSKIEYVKNNIINYILLGSSLLGIILYLTSLFQARELGFGFNNITDLLVLLSIVFVTIYRKKISLNIKYLVVITGIFSLIFIDIYVNGIYAFDKMFLIIVPLLSLLAFKLRQVIIIFSISILGYIILGYLYVNGHIENNIDYTSWMFQSVPWLLNIIIITIISFVVVVIFRQFSQAFFSLIDTLNSKNEELEKYKNRLEFLVKERTEELETTNEELLSTNEELNQQREELKTILNDLKQAQSRLISAEKMSSLGILSAGIAHEINNPLNFIQGGLWGLKNYFEEHKTTNDKEIDMLLKAIEEGVFRASEIVSSLNHFNRQTESKQEDCDIHKTIDNCLVILGGEINGRIDVVKNFTKESPIIKGNDGKLHQAILNILTNSVQAITNEGVIKIDTKVEKNNFIIIIEDTGEGISKDDLTKILDPFFTTKAPGKGTGLGLSITHSIIEEHLGEIKYESEINKGTQVTIILPLK
jgi:signal transduction histidine kinase